MPVLFGGHNLPPLVVIGLTDLPKSGTPRDNRPDLMVRKGFFTRPQISARDKERSAQLDVAFLPQIAISLLLFVIGSLLNVKTNLEIIEVGLSLKNPWKLILLLNANANSSDQQCHLFKTKHSKENSNIDSRTDQRVVSEQCCRGPHTHRTLLSCGETMKEVKTIIETGQVLTRKNCCEQEYFDFELRPFCEGHLGHDLHVLYGCRTACRTSRWSRGTQA